MGNDFETPLTVEQMYGDWGIEWEDLLDLADRSLSPRPRTSIYDSFATLDIDSSSYVLDIGGRDASQALDLAERFGCSVLSVDPVETNVHDAQKNISSHPAGHLVETALGTINRVPAEDDTFDAVFSRDMMGHVHDLTGAFEECRRVLKGAGGMLIHDVFATPQLEPLEARQLIADLAMAEQSLDNSRFERLLADAGFKIASVDRIGSEWLENALEGEDGEHRLLTAARLNRDKERLVYEMGVVPYRVFRANNLWTIYRMIGKLDERVYVVTL